ncbi:hypothetical protein MC885_009270 [Smutsia gigantea]|nr:hypothetical protein MC885_009270 [Smutsia gigantea]
MDGRVRERLRVPLPFRVLLRLRLRLGYDWDATVTRASIASIESNAKTQPGICNLLPNSFVPDRLDEMRSPCSNCHGNL